MIDQRLLFFPSLLYLRFCNEIRILLNVSKWREAKADGIECYVYRKPPACLETYRMKLSLFTIFLKSFHYFIFSRSKAYFWHPHNQNKRPGLCRPDHYSCVVLHGPVVFINSVYIRLYSYRDNFPVLIIDEKLNYYLSNIFVKITIEAPRDHAFQTGFSKSIGKVESFVMVVVIC